MYTLKQNNIKKKWVLILLVLLPSIFLLQPYFYKPIGIGIMWFRLIILPLILFLYFRKIYNINYILIFFTLMLVSSINGTEGKIKEINFLIICLLDSIIFYKVGVYFSEKYENNHTWSYLINGIFILNFISLIAFIAVQLGLLDMQYIFSVLEIDTDDFSTYFGTSRFSLGNAIELPFITTALLYVAIKNSPNNNYIISCILNFVIAGISESRIVALIALLLLIKQWSNSTRIWKVSGILILLLIGNFFYQDYIDPITKSIIDRAAGNDYGSIDFRKNAINTIIENLDIGNIFIGNGLTSSNTLVYKYYGVYRTVESALLQLIYDIGALGTFFFFSCMFIGKNKPLNLNNFTNPIVYLLWIQAIMLLPVGGLMPLTFFSLGAVISFKK